MRILVATDFSTRAHLALRRAGLLARAGNADLSLVHVVDDDRPNDLVALETREAERILAELTKSLAELQGVRCHPMIVAGDPFDGILRAAGSVQADLIVLGAHRRQLLRDIFVGTTIERVIRTSPYPVLMVNKSVGAVYSKVFLAADMSEPSARAIRAGSKLGLLDGSQLTFVHAFFAPGARLMARADITKEDIARYVASEQLRARNELTAFIRREGSELQDWSLHLSEGTPIEVIENAVKAGRPELLVIGTQGRSGLSRALLGSVAENVLRSADVDVLAVPPAR